MCNFLLLSFISESICGINNIAITLAVTRCKPLQHRNITLVNVILDRGLCLGFRGGESTLRNKFALLAYFLKLFVEGELQAPFISFNDRESLPFLSY